MDDNSFSVKSILQLEMNCVAGLGADGRTWELPVDRHHQLLFAVRRCVYVAHLPFEAPDGGSAAGVQKNRHDASDDEQERGVGHASYLFCGGAEVRGEEETQNKTKQNKREKKRGNTNSFLYE